MGLAPHPDNLAARRALPVESDEPTPNQVRAEIVSGPHDRQRVRVGNTPVIMLRRLVSQRFWEGLGALMDISELASSSDERWQVARRQMLTHANKLDADIKGLIESTLMLGPDQMPATERKGKDT